jgi:hypothetical protein
VPSRYLLFSYYLLRGLSLLFLPHTLAHSQLGLNWFAVFYGLDWVATVPPTVRLTSDCFGRKNAGVIYGWIGAAHQLGAAFAAVGAGFIRTHSGDYRAAFWISGTVWFLTGVAFLFTAGPLSTRLPLPLSVSRARPGNSRSDRMTMQFHLTSMKDRASRCSILKLLLISIPVALTRNTMALLRPMARTAEPLLPSQIKTAQQGERMPLVRIDLIEGNLPEYRTSVGQVVYDKLIAVFDVPKNDRFQVITEHPKTHLHFDPEYLGIHRSDACVFIQITLNTGRTVEQKQ